MYTKILDSERQKLLRALTTMLALADFYLAGGTALSLQLGLRESHDFDFFTQHRFNENALFDDLRKKYPNLEAVQVGADTCDVLINDIQVSFFYYPYPVVGSLIVGEPDFPALHMAGPDDIAAMKLSAIGSRGSRKDFYDLYQIYKNIQGFTSEHLLKTVHEKFGPQLDIGYMIVGLGYFEDAEAEILPPVFVPARWEDIKVFFTREQQILYSLEAKRFGFNLDHE